MSLLRLYRGTCNSIC